MKNLLLILTLLIAIVNSNNSNANEQLIDIQTATTELATKLNLNSSQEQKLNEVLKETKTQDHSQRRFYVCVQAGGAMMVDVLLLQCRNFNGSEVLITVAGGGASLSLEGGIAFMKRGRHSTRKLKAGTYSNVSYVGLHAGLGLNRVVFHNDLDTIHYTILGLTVGLGMNFPFLSIVTVEDI